MSPSVREGLMSDAAVFQARRRGRVDSAEKWLAAMPEKTQIPWLRPRAEAAICEAQGNIQGALRVLDDVEKAILAESNQTLREISLRFLRRWQCELRGT